MYVYACMYACMYARASDCGQIIIRTHDHDQHTNGHSTNGHSNGTQDHRQESNHKQREKPAYIGIFADNEKKYKKSLKKFGNMKKPPYLCSRNQKTKQQ